MKTVLWATLSANGNYASARPGHPPRPEALKDFTILATASGNFIAGRKTFEGFRASGAGKVFQNIDIVVVSGKGASLPGVHVVSSPREALRHMKDKGFEVALLSGGETLHKAFLAEDLIDEVIFNFAPVFERRGMNLVLPSKQYKEVQLIELKDLGGGVVQHRYLVKQ